MKNEEFVTALLIFYAHRRKTAETAVIQAKVCQMAYLRKALKEYPAVSACTPVTLLKNTKIAAAEPRISYFFLPVQNLVPTLPTI